MHSSEQYIVFECNIIFITDFKRHIHVNDYQYFLKFYFIKYLEFAIDRTLVASRSYYFDS